MTTKHIFCAPDKVNNKFTCFSFQSLQKIANTWNKTVTNKNNKINNSLINAQNNDENKYNLWKDIQLKLAKTSPCTKDYCLLDNKSLGELEDVEIEFETFRPPKPDEWYKNKNAWLSTTDIQHVILQYENKYPDFEFIGPVPIDFDKKVSLGGCIVNELCNLDIEKLYKNGKRKIGVVFNLDPHDKPGSHWVSLFVNMNNGGIYFYDSVGKFPTKEISDLMFRIRSQGNNLIKQGKIDFNELEDTHHIKKNIQAAGKGKYRILNSKTVPKFLVGMSVKLLDKRGRESHTEVTQIENIENNTLIVGDNSHTTNNRHTGNGGDYDKILVKGFRLFYNDIGHQTKNTECGVYSIHFIEALLNGMSFVEYTNKITRDKEMNKNRDRLYRPSKHEKVI